LYKNITKEVIKQESEHSIESKITQAINEQDIIEDTDYINEKYSEFKEIITLVQNVIEREPKLDVNNMMDLIKIDIESLDETLTKNNHMNANELDKLKKDFIDHANIQITQPTVPCIEYPEIIKKTWYVIETEGVVTDYIIQMLYNTINKKSKNN